MAIYRLKAVDKKFPGVHALKAVNFEIRRGEIVGLEGENGAGREAVLRTIYGMRTPVAGSVRLKGQPVSTFTPQAAVAAGVGHVPRERKVEGIVAGMTAYENMTLSQRGRYARAGVLNVAAEKVPARDWIGKLPIKAHSE